METLEYLKAQLRKYASPGKAKSSSRFFKTGPHQYGEGDRFIGVTVPEQRQIALQFKDLPLKEVEQLLRSPIHEERLVALLILVGQFANGDETVKKEVYNFYLSNTDRVNNWDLVDSSAEYIVGNYLIAKTRETLYKLSSSSNLWEKRIAIISTFSFIKQGQADDTLGIAEILLTDKEDLIQKAVGWMLREVGKRVSEKALEEFLAKHYQKMPRTTLRYAIERLPPEKRKHYLSRVL